MASLPYIQLYVADYLADTMHLTTEEHGAYLLLIMNYWQTGKPIPKSRLAPIARISNGRWNSVENSLKEFFVENENGSWLHERIEGDLEKVYSKSTQASKAGKASAAKRALNKSNSNGRSNSVEQNDNHKDKDKDKDKDKTNVSTEDRGLAIYIHEKIKELNPKAKDPNIDKWANEIRLMRERDKRSHEEIMNIFTWANNDPFWRTNILSPAKLRKQFDQLTIKSGGENNGSERQGQNNGNGNTSRAKQVSDKLNEIAERDIDNNGHSSDLGSGSL